MSTATITKIRLPALGHVPEGVPSDIQMAIAHPDGFPMIADAHVLPIRAVGHFLRLECPSPKTALAYRDDIYEFMIGIEAQGRSWNDPALIDDDFRAYRNMLRATPGATGRKRVVDTIKHRLAGLKKTITLLQAENHQLAQANIALKERSHGADLARRAAIDAGRRRKADAPTNVAPIR